MDAASPVNLGEDLTEQLNKDDAEKIFAVSDLDGTLYGHVGTMRVFRKKIFGGCEYKEVNIHSKLLLVDDEFALIGSANLNQRSMCTDAEAVIGTTQIGLAQSLRLRLFNKLTTHPYTAEDTGKRIYDLWKETMNKNWKAYHNEQPLKGSLCYLHLNDNLVLPNID